MVEEVNNEMSEQTHVVHWVHFFSGTRFLGSLPHVLSKQTAQAFVESYNRINGQTGRRAEIEQQEIPVPKRPYRLPHAFQRPGH